MPYKLAIRDCADIAAPSASRGPKAAKSNGLFK